MKVTIIQIQVSHMKVIIRQICHMKATLKTFESTHSHMKALLGNKSYESKHLRIEIQILAFTG